MDGHDLTELAQKFGTPLHVASARVLRTRARELRASLAGYPSELWIAYSYKTNLVAGVLKVLHEAKIAAEVVDGYELWLAQRLGVPAGEIIFNGPAKSRQEIEAAVEAGIGLLVIDGLEEIDGVAEVADRLGRKLNVALRICPNIVPRGMNTSSVTGSRRNQFGLDLASGEASEALRRVRRHARLSLRGVHTHIGSGIHELESFRAAVDRVLDVQKEAWRMGFTPDLVDLGGGLGTRNSREMSTLEMLWYLGTGRLPKFPRPSENLVPSYGAALCESLTRGARARGITPPMLVIEPGRALSSDAQVLLLTVQQTRSRPGVGRFALVDGGAMTTAMMFLSEYHAVLLANRDAAAKGRTSVFGRLPSPMDVVYRNLPTPELVPGDVLAVMDAGAYFTSTSTNFGGPRPAVVLIDGAEVRVSRRRETFEDLARVELELSEGPS